MKFKVVIPARLASTRLKEKLLLDLEGKPVLQWAWEAAKQSKAQKVYIATDSQEIFDIGQKFGADVLMTSKQHSTGTDRIAESAQILNLQADEILVNVQGDEPLMNPSLIDQVAKNLAENQQASIATLCAKIETWADFINPSVVKVIRDKKGMALTFSRSPIPFPRDLIGVDLEKLSTNTQMPEQANYKRHLGIYAYRVEFLQDFAKLEQGELELQEHLEQLRALENGYKIHIEIAKATYQGGIDTQSDLDKIREILKQTNKN